MNQNAIKALTEKLGRPTEAEGGPAPVKLGRCECDSADCALDSRKDARRNPFSHGQGWTGCQRDAVRLVTVRGLEGLCAAERIPYGSKTEWRGKTLCGELPMCRACAEYHERGAK